MIRRLTWVALVLSAGVACAPPVEEPADPAGPALLFAGLPDAFVLPADDVDETTVGLQVAVVLRIENDDTIGSVTLQSATSTTAADVVDGQASAQVTIDVGLPPTGANNLLTASAGALSVQRSVLGLDEREAPPPIPGVCAVVVDVVGDAVVTCSGGDPADGDAQTLLNGGVIALRTAPANDDANARTRMVNMSGGSAQFAFAFDVDGDYVFAATLAGSESVFGATLTCSAAATVDVD